ncbi:hypothetical protein GF312_18830 [Candidatus Poribacteria bacterium]|nr:hypothetical protein [Candidatus Poribacteria bacterium]
MEALDTGIAKEISDHIKKEILMAVPSKLEHLSTENLEALSNSIHTIKFYCTHRKISPEVLNELDSALETSDLFWELLQDNSKTLSDLKGTYRMRWLDLGSGVLTELEEIISGEETFRDVIINSIAILLAWKSDTVWVDMAKDDHSMVSKNHVLKMRDMLWKFVSESSNNGSETNLKKAVEMGKKMELLMKFVAGDDMPVAASVMLLSQIYILLLRLRISKILIKLNTEINKGSNPKNNQKGESDEKE